MSVKSGPGVRGWGLGMLKIPKAIHDELIAHAREGFPLEVCGLLGGLDGTVATAYRLTNTDASNEHFSMEPHEQFAAVKAMRAAGEEMLAIYHSHPETPARPSQEDIRLALTPGVSYVIISLADAEAADLRSFKIDKGVVRAEEVETI
jgi:[CysO sulfur-carrier protein]-S-L-cysteine hydrolase